jgi:hypothetical protein
VIISNPEVGGFYHGVFTYVDVNSITQGINRKVTPTNKYMEFSGTQT